MTSSRVGGPTKNDLPRWKSAARRMVEAGQRLDPTTFVSPPADVDPGTVDFVCVYRRRNADVVSGIIEQLPPGATVRLWALDEIAPSIEHLTVGCGPGGRLDLLNRLIDDDRRPDLLVIADDDFDFVVGDLERLLRLGAWLGMEVFQPSHTRRSKTAHGLARKKWLTIGRRTTFVEEGPLVVLSQTAQSALLPFPGDFGMGWGLEVRWHAHSDELRFGVVDAVAIRHVRSGIHAYDIGPEQDRLRSELDRVGFVDLAGLQRTVERFGLLAHLLRRGTDVEGRPRR